MGKHLQIRLEDAHVDPTLLWRFACGETAPPCALTVHHVLPLQSSEAALVRPRCGRGLSVRPGAVGSTTEGRHAETPQVICNTGSRWTSCPSPSLPLFDLWPVTFHVQVVNGEGQRLGVWWRFYSVKVKIKPRVVIVLRWWGEEGGGEVVRDGRLTATWGSSTSTVD